MTRFLFCFALSAAVATPAYAQQLKLEINAGRVTLDATNVPARQILAEWAKVGGTKVVGGDKVTGTPLTLKLIDVPERQALDIVLRNVAGFMAAQRLASSAPGASMYDRILILPTSAAPSTATNSRATPAQNTGMAGTQRRVPGRPPNLGNTDNDVAETEVVNEDASDTGVNQPVFTFPGANTGTPPNTMFVPVPNPGNGATPAITLQPNANGQPAIYNFVPAPGSTVPPAQTTFGVVGSPTPGMIQQPAQPSPAGPKPPPK